MLLTSFTITNDNVINGKIDHVDIGSSTTIYCNNCYNLTELPLWPNVTLVMCYNCLNLTKLPLWPNVKEVLCHNCPNLIELPLWPNVLKVICYNCPNLTELPLWPNVINIHSNTVVWSTIIPNIIYTDIDDSMCIICLQHDKKVIFNNCYHLYCCKDCAIKLYESTQQCPICKENIESMTINHVTYT